MEARYMSYNHRKWLCLHHLVIQGAVRAHRALRSEGYGHIGDGVLCDSQPNHFPANGSYMAA